MMNILNRYKVFNSPQNFLRRHCLDCLLWSGSSKIRTSTKPKNHYEILNLSTNCSSKDIREAFITLSKKYHPDKNKGNQKAQEEFVRVSEAYNVLIKPESRREYDFRLKSFTGPNRVYSSQNKDDFYEVHRYDSHYRDPWKDPSFYKNRNFDEEDRNDNYYGIKGIKKQTNDTVIVWIFVLLVVGLFLQISIIRFANSNTRMSRDRQSDENRRYLEFVKARAEYYGTRERQMEEFNRRLGTSMEDNKPESDIIKKDESE